MNLINYLKMYDEINEKTKQFLTKPYRILTVIFCQSNLFIILFNIFFIKSKNKDIKFLKYSFCGIIFMESVASIFYTIFRYTDNSLAFEFIYSLLLTVEFYFILLYIYHIFNNSEISKLARKTKLIQPIKICIIFYIFIFSYDAFSFLNKKVINIIQSMTNLCGILILYIYLRHKIKEIQNNLEVKAFLNKRIFSYLKFINNSSLYYLTIYNIIKLLSIFLFNQVNLLYIEIALNTIKVAFKYFMFFFFSAITYQLSNKKPNLVFDEAIKITLDSN